MSYSYSSQNPACESDLWISTVRIDYLDLYEVVHRISGYTISKYKRVALALARQGQIKQRVYREDSVRP